MSIPSHIHIEDIEIYLQMDGNLMLLNVPNIFHYA